MAERMVLAQSTRSYREGIRAYIAVEEADEAAFLNQAYGTDFREAYGHYPDEDIEARGKKEQHAANPGDVRAAMVPFLAHAHYGPTYKWLLYGDDDTVFYMDAVKRMVSGFDPELPIALTDNLWYEAAHPRLEAVRCLPCGFDASSLPAAQTSLGYAPRPACPYCTPAGACPEDKPTCGPAGAHGGAGIIVSVGLMKQVTLAMYEGCVNETYGCSGGDCLFSNCLWRLGYGFTDPGHSLLYESPLEHVTFDNAELRHVLKNPIQALVLDHCKGLCVDTVRHAVAFHLRGRSFKTFSKAAAGMFALATSHKAAVEYLDLDADKGSRGAAAYAAELAGEL